MAGLLVVDKDVRVDGQIVVQISINDVSASNSIHP